jgi:hypothetical protein
VSAQRKLIFVLAACLVLVLIVGTIAFQFLSGPDGKTRQVKLEPATQESAAPAAALKPEGEWLPKFKSVYVLADGELLRRVPEPYIPERMDFYRAHVDAKQVRDNPAGPRFWVLDDDGKDFAIFAGWYGSGDNVEAMIITLLQIDRTSLVGPDAVLDRRLGGDLVVRKSATAEQKSAAFAEMLGRDLKKSFTLRQQEVEREAISVSGKFAYKGPTTATAAAAATAPAPAERRMPPHLVVYRGEPRGGRSWITAGTVQFLHVLPHLCRMPVVVDGDLGGQRTPWELDRSAYENLPSGRRPDAAQVDEVLANIAAQSQLRFRRENRVIKTWVLSETASTSPAR